MIAVSVSIVRTSVYDFCRHDELVAFPRDASSRAAHRDSRRRRFAIALTLLVLTIRVPTATSLDRPDELATAVAEAWPFLLAYFAALVTVGVTWLTAVPGRPRGGPQRAGQAESPRGVSLLADAGSSSS